MPLKGIAKLDIGLQISPSYTSLRAMPCIPLALSPLSNGDSFELVVLHDANSKKDDANWEVSNFVLRA